MSSSDRRDTDPAWLAWLADQATKDERERAYDLTLRLERQAQILSDLRTRTAAVLAAAGVAAALFAQRALTTTVPPGASALYIAGGVALLVLAGLCWPILQSLNDRDERDVANYCTARKDGWPKEFKTAQRKWRTTVNLEGLWQLRQINRIQRALDVEEKSLVELTVFLSLWRKMNYKTIEQRNNLFSLVSVVFVLVVALGILGLTQT